MQKVFCKSQYVFLLFLYILLMAGCLFDCVDRAGSVFIRIHCSMNIILLDMYAYDVK